MVKRRDLLVVGCLAVAGAVGQAHASLPQPDTAGFMVFFEENSAAIPEKALRALERAAADANGRFDGAVAVEGYTDRDERAPGLAARRAEAVLNRLVSLGIDPQRLAMRAWEGRPLVDNPPGVAEAQNRRVSIELVRRCWPNCPDDGRRFSGSSRD